MGAGEPRSSLISDFFPSSQRLGENEILHGVHPEPKIETLRCTQGDKRRRVQNDIVVPVTLREAKSL
jgi:hypothetical protein